MSLTGQSRVVKKKCIVVRADASATTGAGHVMRCLTVCKSLSELGFQCVFIQDYIELDWLKVLIEKTSCTLQPLSQISLLQGNTHILLIDSYKVDSNDKELNIVNWGAIVQIVDPESPLIQSNMYISPNPMPDPRLADLRIPKYEGIEYIPIRDEFLINESYPNSLLKSEPRILISGGGANIFNFAENICEILRNTNFPLEVTALTSEETIANWKDSRFNVCRLGNLNTLDISSFNIFITTAGQSSWEFLATKKHLGIVLGISNQRNTFDFLVENNLAYGLGFHDKHGWNINQGLLIDLILGSGSERTQTIPRPPVHFGLGAKLISEKIFTLFDA